MSIQPDPQTSSVSNTHKTSKLGNKKNPFSEALNDFWCIRMHTQRKAVFVNWGMSTFILVSGFLFWAFPWKICGCSQSLHSAFGATIQPAVKRSIPVESGFYKSLQTSLSALGLVFPPGLSTQISTSPSAHRCHLRCHLHSKKEIVLYCGIIKPCFLSCLPQTDCKTGLQNKIK